MTIEQTAFQLIPLNKLMASPRNVRRTDRKADIQALAASISAQGLLQNLCVVPAETGKFEVDAGGRRLQALKLLAKSGKIAKDFSVPCNVVSVEAGVEVSLTENVHRVAMDAMDEVNAFAALAADGASADEIAQRFGVTRRHVDQRLALSKLSPKIKAAWKRGDVSLEAARAFCLVDDHAQQEAVYRSLGRPVTHAGSVRARLMDGRIRASDRWAVFVGLDAYEQAGGKLVRDLFDEDAVFIENPALLTKLAEDKLEVASAKWVGEGWSWVSIQLGAGRGDGMSAKRLHPDWREPTTDEQAELDRLSAEIEKLDADLEADSVEDDPRWSQRDDLEAAYETVRQAGRCWPDEVKQLSGVVLSVDHDGDIFATEGLVKVDDQKRVDAYLRNSRVGEADADGDMEGRAVETKASHVSALPKVVNRDLTLARTRAIRLRLSGDSDIALALCVVGLAMRSLHHAEFTGVAISASARPIEDLPAFEEAKAEIEGRLPEDELDLLDWALGLSRERLLGVLAALVAGAVDLAHEDTSPADLRRQAVADRLAQHLDIDMRQYWSADLDFWSRLPKAFLLARVPEAPDMVSKGERTREDAIKAHAKLRKDDLAAKVASLFEGAGYLPDILLTPVPRGVLELTDVGEAAVSVPSVAAE